MDALFVNITATGYNPNYCRLTSVITADLNRPPYCGCANEVGTLDEERMVLTALCNSINGRTLVYNNTRAISFITAVCSQYSLEFSPSEIRPLAECLEELEIDKDAVINSIPKYNGELKHFYKDYKDYYYLPAEDQAYHKSVAGFVDKSARVQATARTAYTKRAGTFVPVLGDIEIDPKLIFQESYRSVPLYTLPQYLDLNNPQVIASYMFCPHIREDA